MTSIGLESVPPFDKYAFMELSCIPNPLIFVSYTEDDEIQLLFIRVCCFILPWRILHCTFSKEMSLTHLMILEIKVPFFDLPVSLFSFQILSPIAFLKCLEVRNDYARTCELSWMLLLDECQQYHLDYHFVSLKPNCSCIC